MKNCIEYIKDGIWQDTHRWVEVITTNKFQTLKCELCGKLSTVKFEEDIKNIENE